MSMRVTAASVVALAMAVAAATPAAAQLKSLETEDLRLISFGGAESYLVPYATRTFLNSMRFQRRLFAFEPAEKTTVLLADFADYGNAGATSVPRDSVTVQIAPLSFAFETMTANERINTIMNHELVHVTTMDQAAGSDRAFRKLFAGKVMPINEQPESILYFYLTTPRVATPRWFLEGGAVFVDTWMAGGIGRAQGAYDEMVFRSMVRDGSRFYDPLGLVSEGTKIDFQVEVNSYLYGTRFMTYLALTQSPEKVVEWLSRKPGSRAYYASQFQHVFGKGLGEAWQDWIRWERGFQKANLEAIRQYPTTPYVDLSKRALGSVSRAYLDRDGKKLYAAFNYPGVVAHVGAINLENGSIDKLADIKGPTIYTVASIAYDPEGGRVFYTRDNRNFRDLIAIDLATRKSRMLLEDARIGDLSFDRTGRALWGIRHFNGICTLVRIPEPYKEWNKVLSWPFGEVAYDLDVSPDGKRLSVSVGEVTGKHSVRVLSTERVLAGDATPVAQFDFGAAIPSNFVFSADGASLYGSSYYTGASNIFRYEIASGKLDAVSNTETGFFRPVPQADGSLIVFRYTGEGFVPARIEARPLEDVSAITFLGERLAETHPVVKAWKLGSPAAIAIETLPQRSRDYSLLGNLRIESIYPVAQGYKEFAAVGLRVNLSDPIQLNRGTLSASYTPDGDLPSEERFHLRAEYKRYDWSGRFMLNNADFYDIVGPTKTGRKGYEAGLGWQKTLVFDEPRRLDLKLDASFSGNLDTLPDYQNVPVDVNELFTFTTQLDHTNVRRSLGYVDDEKGRRSSLVFEGNYVDGKALGRLHGTFDFGFSLPIGHSSVWLRNAAGYSPRSRDEPFANFFFGGFGNNWLDHLDEKRYREYYSFPGAELNEIGGRNFVKTMAEWNLPPVRFRRVGSPGFYMTWARPALFASLLVTDLDDSDVRREVTNAGGQLDFRFTVLSALDMTLSGGYAVAFEDGFPPRREWMASLKVLR